MTIVYTGAAQDAFHVFHVHYLYRLVYIETHGAFYRKINFVY